MILSKKNDIFQSYEKYSQNLVQKENIIEIK